MCDRPLPATAEASVKVGQLPLVPEAHDALQSEWRHGNTRCRRGQQFQDAGLRSLHVARVGLEEGVSISVHGRLLPKAPQLAKGLRHGLGRHGRFVTAHGRRLVLQACTRRSTCVEPSESWKAGS